jgi:DNA modification methylase
MPKTVALAVSCKEKTPGEAKNKQHHRDALLKKYQSILVTNPELNRRLVSFQANRQIPVYKWFKYKEGFSADLVEYVIAALGGMPGTLLDPFAGSGTALFAASDRGWKSIGIELLPIGQLIAEARLLAEQVKLKALWRQLDKAAETRWEDHYDEAFRFRHITITERAFPPSTERAIAGYRAYCAHGVRDSVVRRLMEFACACVLEEVSYTRKDGQYLRWDSRSGKARESGFSKGPIRDFSVAIRAKLQSMYSDIFSVRCPLSNGGSSSNGHNRGMIDYRRDSCLRVLPTFDASSIDLVVTSPPYCNRYDYTRTYALELVLSGCDETRIKDLRQEMLSCTVENREKAQLLHRQYQKAGREDAFDLVNEVFNEQDALHEVLSILEGYRSQGRLNNGNIVKMVRNYFYETCFVVFELARSLRPGGHIVVINDNVRYAGEEVPVDLILTSMAERFGLVPCHIWVLPRGKGNSSQQMGNHGRAELRKCVYLWRKPVY